MAYFKISPYTGGVKSVQADTIQAAASQLGLSMSGLNKKWSATAITEDEYNKFIPGVPTVPSVPSVPAVGNPPLTGSPQVDTGGAAAPTMPEISAKTKITIPVTQAELAIIANAEAKGLCVGAMRTYYTIKTYKVKLKGGDTILVEALSKKSAREKAEKAGHKVGWVTKQIGTTKEVAPTKQAKSALTENQQRVKDPLAKKGAWKDEYLVGDGFDLVLMLQDAYQHNAKVNPSDLRELFGTEAVNRAGDTVRLYNSLDQHKDSAGNYDLIGIIQDKNISRDQIKKTFGEETYKWAEDTSWSLHWIEPYKTEDGYNLTQAFAENAITRDQAQVLFDADTVNTAFKDAATYKKLPETQKAGGISAKDVGLIAGDVLVPFFYVARNWDNLSVGARIGWIALDIAFFIVPMAGSAVRGARGAAGIGKVARLAGAAKGVGRELVASIKGPITTIMHPVATTRQGLKDIRSLATNIANWKKIPEAVLTTTEGTARLRITSVTKMDEFMRTRDKLMRLAARGEKPIVQIKDKAGKIIAEIQLTKAPLMREAKGGVVHTTPWGGSFKESLTVKPKLGMGMAEQGLFVSHEPLPRFANQSAFNMPIEIRPAGGSKQLVKTKIGYNQIVHINLESKLPSETFESLTKAKLIGAPEDIDALSRKKVNNLINALRQSGNAKAADVLQQTAEAYKPMFRIISPDKVDELVGTGKVYRSTVEMEAKFPVGTKIKPPEQKLFTYIGPEAARVEIWLDKPLTVRQIAKLKLEGLAEVFRQPFRPPLKIKAAKGLTRQQVKELSNILKIADNTDVARSLERAYQLSRSAKRLTQATTRAGIGIITRARARAPRGEIGYIAEARRLEATRKARRPAATERAERPEARAERLGERAERTERAERPEARAERLGERAERTERAERPERTARAERLSRITRTERPGRGERGERPTRIERVERIERPERIERLERLGRPRRLTKLTKRELKPIKLTGLERPRPQGPALAVLKQGIFWISIFPPFRTTGKKEDVVYSREKPPWGSVIARGRHAPKRTLRSMGKVPELITVPMGAVTARIRNGRHLSFSRNKSRRRGRLVY